MICIVISLNGSVLECRSFSELRGTKSAYLSL
jgi:hypothetical protein